MVEDRRDLLHCGDCLPFISRLGTGTIDTVVTSPPYALQRDYSGASATGYIDFIEPICTEIKRVLKDSGSFFLNIKEHCTGGQRDLYVYKLVIHLVETVGFRFVDEFVWHKTNPFPTGSKKRLKDGWERVYHFTKTKDYKFYPERVMVKSESKWLEGEKRRKNKGEHNTTNNSGMNMSKRVCSDMVRPSNVITGSTSNINIGHPAVFPVYLPQFFIKLTTDIGDTVLDPFMGSGTTGLACEELDVNFIGIELDRDYFDIAKNRILKGEN